MPETRSHRGPHPEDRELFAERVWPRLRRAVGELSWLLSRRYAMPSAVKLVGDRHELSKRQRIAVQRSACSDQARQRRAEHEVEAKRLGERPVLIDGFNIITTVEAALAGGVLLRGRDGAIRDMASMHGSYRKVSETRPAVERIGRALAELEVGEAVWLLDSPVSNSGRLKTVIGEVAAAAGWVWEVQTVADPDALLIESEQVVVSADSVVLDRCRWWFNLGAAMVGREAAGARVVDLCVSAA